MSGRSPSGVASLRARFEQSKDSTSPPSRGRSPAGSATSDHSRPISKVRTSFVSVEGSGNMGDLSNSPETEGREVVSGEGMGRSKEPTNGDAMDRPKTNGSSSIDSMFEEKSVSASGVTPEPTGTSSTTTDAKPPGLDGTSDANPDKPVSTAEEETAGMQPADPKDEAAVSGGAALAEDNAGLGSILKGSPFQKDEEKKASTSNSTNAKAVIAQPRPPKSQTKPSTNGLINGKPKDASSSKSVPQPKLKNTGPPGSAQTKPAPAPAPSDATTSSDGKLQAAARPATIKTESAGPPAPSVNKDTVESHSERTEPPEPHTPLSATASTKQLTPNEASAKPGKPKEPKKDTAKDTKKPTGRPSAITKPAPAAAAKPHPATGSSSTKPLKKSTSTSPKSTATKPRPKSPTRPARLPATATAPTAASAAKLDGPPPSTNDRKPMNYLSVRDQAHPKSVKPQPKPARTSLPARSKPDEKPKGSKPRQSMASSKAPEGSFLDRMMRPTQSSSQKTHEKVEVRSPPRKQHVMKPKRISEGSDKSRTDHADAKVEPSKEPSITTDQPSAEPKEGPSPGADGANASISAAAHTVPPTIPVP